MNQKNTSFGVETAFSDIKLGDSIILYDGEWDVMIQGEVISKNCDGCTARMEDGCVFWAQKIEKIWVVRELRIEVDADYAAISKTFCIQDTGDDSYLENLSCGIFTPWYSKALSFHSYSSAISYIQDTFITSSWPNFRILTVLAAD